MVRRELLAVLQRRVPWGGCHALKRSGGVHTRGCQPPLPELSLASPPSLPCPAQQDPWGQPAYGWAAQELLLRRKYENVSLGERLPQVRGCARAPVPFSWGTPA